LQAQLWFNEGLEDRWFVIQSVIGTLTLMPPDSTAITYFFRREERLVLEVG
jgi:hypothetical protein